MYVRGKRLVADACLGSDSEQGGFLTVRLTCTPRNVQARMSIRVCTFALSVALFLTLFHSCRDLGSNYTYVTGGGVTVSADDSSLLITNNGAETVYYLAVEQVTFTVIDWIETCDSGKAVPSGAVKSIPYSSVTGYKKGCRVVVVFWHCSGTMGAIPGSLWTIEVQTP